MLYYYYVKNIFRFCLMYNLRRYVYKCEFNKVYVILDHPSYTSFSLFTLT